jgi:hypothetical protein
MPNASAKVEKKGKCTAKQQNPADSGTQEDVHL